MFDAANLRQSIRRARLHKRPNLPERAWTGRMRSALATGSGHPLSALRQQYRKAIPAMLAIAGDDGGVYGAFSR